jgi:hypothetical protein
VFSPYAGSKSLFGTTTTDYTGKVDVVGGARIDRLDANLINYLRGAEATQFSNNLTNVITKRLTGVLDPVLTLPSTAGRKYLVHSIHVSNIARVQPQGAGGGATISVSGVSSVYNFDAFSSLRVPGTYSLPSDTWTTGGSGTEANFILTIPLVGNIQSFSNTPGTTVSGEEDQVYTNVSGATSGSGAGATFTITRDSDGAILSVIGVAAGRGYSTSDTITILGSSIGGVDDTDDIIITITDVEGRGLISTFTPSAGTTIIGEANQTYTSVSGSASLSGAGATFTVSRDEDGAISNVIVVSPGEDYVATETILIDGGNIGGVTGTDDLTITVDTVSDVLPTVVVDYAGIGFAVDDVITVADSNLGNGGAPAFTFDIQALTGVVQSVDLLVPGEGYNVPPEVFFDAGVTGSGAIITSEVDSDGKIIRLNVINRGAGYVAVDGNLLRISEPPLKPVEIGISGRFDISSTNVQSYFGFSVPIPIGGALELLKQPQVLSPSDVIRMQTYDEFGSGLNAGADVYITYEEIEDTKYYGNALALTSTTSATILTAPSTRPLFIRSIRLTNTEFVGDYDVSVLVNTGTSSFYLVRNIMIPAFATVEICDTPKRIEPDWTVQLELAVVGQDVNIASTIDVQVSAKEIVV